MLAAFHIEEQRVAKTGDPNQAAGTNNQFQN
jgi:hypothetical protein